MIDAEGRIVLWNLAAEKILGHTACEALVRHCCDVFAWRDDHDNHLCDQGCHVMALLKMAEPVQSPVTGAPRSASW